MKNIVLTAFLCIVTLPGLAQIIKQKVIDSGGNGLYKAIATTEATLSGYVIYRPESIEDAFRVEGKLPVLVFANGGCSDTSITHEKVLSEIASHGYIVIAIGAMQMDIADRKHNSTPGSMLTDAVDWVVKRSREPQNDYSQKVDINKIALGGQSCGGAQVLSIAADTRIKSYLMFNSGMGEMEMAGASKRSLKNVHAPIIYIIGGISDVAYANAIKDYENIEKHIPVAFADLTEGGHMGTFAEPFGGSYARMAIAWLDWQLKKKNNSLIFLQSQLNAYPGWTMKSKNF